MGKNRREGKKNRGDEKKMVMKNARQKRTG